jgi:pilus assembly protein CpaB
MTEKKILITAVIVAVVAMVLINLYVAGIRRDYTADPVIVLQAIHAVPAGKPVTAADYKEIPLPRKIYEQVISYAVTKQDLPILAATPLRRQLNNGDIISYSHLSRTVQEGLRDMIAPGQRAVSIQVSEETSVSNFVQPGDMVDIMATLMGGQAAAARNVTKPLLTGIRVLAVGGDYADTNNRAFAQRGRYNTVTLELSMEQAERVIAARDQLRATMTLLLRNPKDQGEVAPTPPINANDLLSISPK